MLASLTQPSIAATTQEMPEDEDRHDAALKAALTLDINPNNGSDKNTHWSPAFSQAKEGELWPCILEKAWAKVRSPLF
jgi:hypothetical protein